MTSKTKPTTGSVTVFTHRVGIDGRLINGERFYAGDKVPADVDIELLQKMRNIKWVRDIPRRSGSRRPKRSWPRGRRVSTTVSAVRRRSWIGCPRG